MMGSDSEHAVILVIGYGNELRGDDGLGPAVAEAVAALGLPHVECLAVRQLLPEMAERLTDARLAVFVDARVGPGEHAVEVTRIEPVESAGLMAHAADPRALLALTRAVYGRAPGAWLVAVRGYHFEFGDGLSLVAVENANEARQRVTGLIGERTCPGARKMA
jgi:hydrogenase maturation protease